MRDPRLCTAVSGMQIQSVDSTWPFSSSDIQDFLPTLFLSFRVKCETVGDIDQCSSRCIVARQRETEMSVQRSHRCSIWFVFLQYCDRLLRLFPRFSQIVHLQSALRHSAEFARNPVVLSAIALRNNASVYIISRDQHYMCWYKLQRWKSSHTLGLFLRSSIIFPTEVRKNFSAPPQHEWDSEIFR